MKDSEDAMNRAMTMHLENEGKETDKSQRENETREKTTKKSPFITAMMNETSLEDGTALSLSNRQQVQI